MEQQETKKEFKPTDPKVMESIIGRDPSEKLTRNIPKFDEDRREAYTGNLRWAHSVEKVI